MIFVQKPNNPIKAGIVLIAKDTPKKVVHGIEKLNIKPLFGAELGFEVKGVRCHIDTQITHLGGGRFVVSPYLIGHYSKILPTATLLAGESAGQGAYPDDAAYNVANTGKYIIHNFKYTDRKVLMEISGERINVAQGYTKCAVCIIDENSVITEDEGIAQTLNRHNIDVLKISAGDVKLSGLDYGFLGGASGKLSENTICFTGDITAHRDYKAILEFCQRKNVKPISLCDGPLTDIGSIIPVAEKE